MVLSLNKNSWEAFTVVNKNAGKRKEEKRDTLLKIKTVLVSLQEINSRPHMCITFDIQLPEYRRGYHLITREIREKLPPLPNNGMVLIFIKHTSAALTLNENADPDVRHDFKTFFSRLVPDGASYFIHTLEGPDDMPAHIKASLLGASVIIPVRNGQLNLGTWQGIYLCEFRNQAGPRTLSITLFGE